MADYGLLGGVAEGLKSALGSYQDEKKRQDELGLKKKMFAAELAGKGLAETSDGGFDYTSDYKKDKGLDRLSKTSGLLKEGYKPSYSETTGEWTTEETPDVELNRGKTRADIALKIAQAKKEEAESRGGGQSGYKRDLETRKLEQELGLIPVNAPAQMNKLGAEGRTKVGYVANALSGLTDMEKAIDAGSKPTRFNPDTPLVGSAFSDTPFTMAKSRVSEAIGRLQSGGAIQKEERMAFDAMGPRPGDTEQIQMEKLKKQRQFLEQKMSAYGLLPEGMGDAGFKLDELGYDPDIKKYANDHGLTYGAAANWLAKQSGDVRK